METSSVATDNSRVLTVKLGRETSLVACSTDKRSNCGSRFIKVECHVGRVSDTPGIEFMCQSIIDCCRLSRATSKIIAF